MEALERQLDTFLRRQPTLGRDVYIARTAVVLGDVTLGDNSSVWYGAVLRGDINRIVVGANSNVQDNAVLHLADDDPCIVGDWVTIGHSANVHACTVEDECLIGIGATVLDGAVIGTQSIVGANALVPPGMKVPPGSMVLGTPGKVVRTANNYVANRLNAMLYHRNGLCYAKGDHRAWDGAAYEAEMAAHKALFEREFAEKY